MNSNFPKSRANLPATAVRVPPSQEKPDHRPVRGPAIHPAKTRRQPAAGENPRQAGSTPGWRMLRLASLAALLFGGVAACFLTLRPSSDLRTITWLPRMLWPIATWADYHGYLRNVPAYALLALPVMVIFPGRKARAGALTVLAIFAAALEFFQLFIPTRFFSWGDIALSWAGLAITWALAEGIRWCSRRVQRILSKKRALRTGNHS
jgi:VanZ like family